MIFPHSISLGAFFGAAMASWILAIPVGRLLVFFKVIDIPNERSSHTKTVIRGGGIAIIAIVLLGCFILLLLGQPELATLALVSVCVAIISFWDDLKQVHPALRFLCHAASSFVAIIWLAPKAGSHYSSSTLVVLVFAACFLWIAGYLNAFNFMDGINGIAAGQAVLTSAGAGILAGLASGLWNDPAVLFAFIVAGAAAGFLPHNFPNARMFMGDVGSAPLGFLLAVLTWWLPLEFGWELLIPLALLHANFVLDTAITLIRRIMRREKWYAAHKEHFYQRLVRAGKSHTFVTMWEMGLQLLVLLLMARYLYAGQAERLCLIFSVIGIWLSFFWYAEMKFRAFTAPKPLEQSVALTT